MSHKAALQRLIPVELGGVFDDDLTVEGMELDLVQGDIETERQAIISDMTTLLPPTDDRMKLTPVRWDIKKPFYVALAANMGYAIRINDYAPTMEGWLCTGDTLMEEPWGYFTAGISMSGDCLAQEIVVSPWVWDVVIDAVPDPVPTPNLDTVMNNLKPAHILLHFVYIYL